MKRDLNTRKREEARRRKHGQSGVPRRCPGCRGLVLQLPCLLCEGRALRDNRKRLAALAADRRPK